MAGDWIKWTKGLARKPEVLCMAARLGKSRHEVAGLLMEVWEWADENVAFNAGVSGSEPDNCPGVIRLGEKPKELLDVVAGVSGFADALAAVNWIEVRSGSLAFPNFARHNGKTAKARSLDSSRKRTDRDSEVKTMAGRPPAVRNVSGSQPDKTRTREEKRREETKAEDPPTPRGGVSTDEGTDYRSVPADDQTVAVADPPARRKPDAGRPGTREQADAAAAIADGSAVVTPEPLEALIAAWVRVKLPGWDAPGGIEVNSHRRGAWQRMYELRPGWPGEWRGLIARLGRSSKAKGADQKFHRGVRLDDFLKPENKYPARINEGEFDDPAAASPSRSTPSAFDRAYAKHTAERKAMEG